jgi:hypothetical protein
MTPKRKPKRQKPKGLKAFDNLMRKLVKIPPLGNGVPVELIGKHPHAGSRGTVSGNVRTSATFPDWRMWLVIFDEPHLGVESAYANETDIKRLD